MENLEDEEITRTTKCILCDQIFLYKNINEHISSVHNIDNYVYNIFDSQVFNEGNEFDLCKNQNSSSSFNNKYNLNLNNMTSSEQIAYTLVLNEEDNKNNKKTKIKHNLKILRY